MPLPPRPYRATRLSGPLIGAAQVACDRLIARRAVILAGLAMGETLITGLPVDDEEMLRAGAAMQALGASVGRGAGGGPWLVAGRGVGGLAEPAGVLEVGGDGDMVRLLAGALASHPLFAVLTGDAELRAQSMRDVTGPLSACGACFTSRDGFCLPLVVEGASDALPFDCVMASASAKGAALLCGLNAPGVSEVTEPVATHDHTENMLRHFGADIAAERTADGSGRVVRLHGQPHLRAADVVVPGDPSLAAFPLVAALLTPGSFVTIPHVCLNPLRGGVFETLREMGASLRVERARVEGGEPVGDLHVEHALLHGVDMPAARARSMTGDETILAVAAAGARGTTRLRGLAAGDRLVATAAMLAANGVRVETVGDDLLVHGTGAAPIGGALVTAGGDEHLAMSALVLGLVSVNAVRVDACTLEFATMMNRLVAGAPALTVA